VLICHIHILLALGGNYFYGSFATILPLISNRRFLFLMRHFMSLIVLFPVFLRIVPLLYGALWFRALSPWNFNFAIGLPDFDLATCTGLLEDRSRGQVMTPKKCVIWNITCLLRKITMWKQTPTIPKNLSSLKIGKLLRCKTRSTFNKISHFPVFERFPVM